MRFIFLVLIFSVCMITLSHADTYHRGDDGVFLASGLDQSVSAQLFQLVDPIGRPDLYSNGVKIFHRVETPSVYQIILHPSEVFQVQQGQGKKFLEVGGRAVGLLEKAFERKGLKPSAEGIIGEKDVWCKVGKNTARPYCTLSVTPTKK